MARIKTQDLAETLEQVRQQLAELVERVQCLEAMKPAAPEIKAATPTPAPVPVKKEAPPQKAQPEMTEEELLVVSAALAAYLGVRVHIKRIRLLSSHAWAQQGRVSIQASHNLHN
jgi:methylmalonyl-CoA carboxyltransferase 12S subunit